MQQRRSVVRRASATTEDEQFYSSAPTMRASARRYDLNTGQRIIRDGNRQIVIHQGPPPQQRRYHGAVLVGVGMIAMLVVVVGFNIVANWLGSWQVDSQYGYPRTYRTEVTVGHGDSELHPSYFIFQNIRGKISIIEMQGGDPSKGKIYTGPVLLGEHADKIPVTGHFSDENGDGKTDMIVEVDNQRIVYLNDGDEFKQQG